MTEIIVTQILGWVATVMFTIMYVPQMTKTYKTGKVSNVSLSMFIMGLIGNIVALIYAILIKQYPLIIKYAAALLIIGIYIVIYYKANNED